MNRWEQEYTNPKLVTLHEEPQATVRRFFRFLKKQKVVVDGAYALDIGCGTGRNALALAQRGAHVSGIDISATAIGIAQKRAANAGVGIEYAVGDIAQSLPYIDDQFSIALDVTASNALRNTERDRFVEELARVTAPGAWLYLRTLCKEGDKNAKRLLEDHPGPEPHTYVMPGTRFVERVFTKDEITALYSPYFSIEFMKKESGYTQFDGQSYKRFFWVAYLRRLDK